MTQKSFDDRQQNDCLPEILEYVDLMKKRALGKAPEMQSAKHIASLIEDAVMPEQKSLTILDVGCGAGHYLRSIMALLPNTKVEYFGVDVDHNMVKAANEVWNGVERVKFKYGPGDELSSLDIPMCDIVFSANAFMYFPNARKALASLLSKTKQTLMVRSYFCEQTYIIRRAQPSEWHPLSTVPESDIIDENGMPSVYDYWNIYSFRLIEHLVRENWQNASIDWHDDRFLDEFSSDEEATGVAKKRGATVQVGDYQVVYPIIQPWKTLVVHRTKAI